jgi:hypothetical protein
MGIEQVSGRLKLLRVHDKGTKYGPPSDQLDVEVIVQFFERPNEAFGFQLRDDSQGPAREGMLGLLRDGFNHGWTVTIDFDRVASHVNNRAIRVVLTRPPGSGGPINVSLSTTKPEPAKGRKRKARRRAAR